MLEYLIGKGMGFEAFCELGIQAVAVIGDSLPTSEEEKTAMGNSEDPEDSEST